MATECLFEVCAHPTDPGSTWALFLGYVTLIPSFVYIVGGIWLFIGLDWPALFFNAGLYVNLGISVLLKVIVRAPRPDPACGTGFGFPSTHTQTTAHVAAAFLTIFALLFIHDRNHSKLHPIYEFFIFRVKPMVQLRVQFFLWSTLWAVIVIFEAVSRVQLQYHTVGQVLGGAFIGTGLGVTWVLVSLWFYDGFVRRGWRWRQKGVRRHAQRLRKQ